MVLILRLSPSVLLESTGDAKYTSIIDTNDHNNTSTNPCLFFVIVFSLLLPFNNNVGLQFINQTLGSDTGLLYPQYLIDDYLLFFINCMLQSQVL